VSAQPANKCPSCGYDYEPWVETCPDCNVPLTTQLAEAPKLAPDPHADPHWTVVTNVPNAILGNLIKSQLEDAGIPVLMMRSPSADIAEFSHNDFVPHDLRVPQNLVIQARQLIDSPPSDAYDPIEWSGESGYEQDDSPSWSGLPETWRMLPSERDIDEMHEARRSHSKTPGGWYWADERQPDAPSIEYEEEYEEPIGFRERHIDPYAQEGDWTQPSKWVKVFYGILLLVMSLPFIMQLLQTMWSIIGGRR
jgi:hypothetical protein